MISEIEIRLRADIARLQQDMNGARQAVGSGLDRINAAVGKTTDLLGGLAVGAAAVSFVQFTKQSIDAADALNDMSIRTKVAIEDLTGLSYAAKLSDTSIDAVSKSINKLGMNIGKDAAKFRELGVTATDPVEAFKQLADIFKSIQDPQQRAAFGAEALGKTWQESAILLDMGSKGLTEMMDKGKQLSGVSAQMATDAANFNDKLDTLSFTAQQAGIRLATDLLPALNAVVDRITDATSATDGANSKFSILATVASDVVAAGGGIVLVFQLIGKFAAAVAGQVAGLVNGLYDLLSFDWGGFIANMKSIPAIGNAFLKDTGDAVEAFGKWEGGLRGVGAAAAKTQADIAAAAGGSIEEMLKAAMAAQDAKEAVAAFLKSEEIAAARKKAATELESARKKAATEAAAAAKKELEARKDAQEKYRAWTQETVDAAQRIKKVQDDAYDSALKEAEANELLAATFGMTKSAIEAEELARLESQLAQKSSIGLTLDEIAQLERLIEVKRRNAAAVGNLEALEKQKKATDDAAKEQVKFWESITATAQSTFVSILDGGKDTATRLRDTFKNIFFDWLFQMTLKKWIVNIQGEMTATGAPGGGSAASSMWSGTEDSIAKSIQKGFDMLGLSMGSGAPGQLAQWLGKAGSTFAGYQAGTGINAAISGQFQTGSGVMAVEKIATAVASYFGGPVGGAIAGAIGGLINRAFGMGAKTATGQGITGQFGAEGFTGGQAFQDWFQKGGWFRSDKSGTEVTALSAEINKQLNDSYNAIRAATVGFADQLGLPVDAIKNYNQQLNLALSGDAVKDQQAIIDMLTGIGNTLATQLLPNIAALGTEGEAASATLQRVAANYAALDAVLGTVGLAFGAVGVDSLAARERLIALSGGMQQLATNIDGFAQNFLTEAERMKPVVDAVGAALSGMNLAWVDTREEFKSVVLGIDKTTEAGAKQFAQLIELQAAFAAVHPAIEATTEALRSAADIAQERTRLQTQLDQLGMTAAQIERAAIAETNKALYDLLTTRKAEIDAAAAQATAAQEAADAIAKAQADAAASLAATNQGYEDQIGAILKLRMTESQLRAVETKGLDASTVALYDRLKALQAEDKATTAAAEAIKKASETAAATIKATQDAFDRMAADREQALAAARTAVQQAYDRESNALQQVIDKSRQAAATLRDYSDALKIGAASILTPEQRYAEARRQFDTATPEQLSSAADALLAASMAYNSNSEKYAADYMLVQEAIGKAATAADNQAVAAESQLTLLALQVEGIATVNRSILSLSDALAQYRSATSAASMAGISRPLAPTAPGASFPLGPTPINWQGTEWLQMVQQAQTGRGGSSKTQASEEVVTLLTGIQTELAIANQQRIGVAEMQTENAGAMTETLDKMTRTLAKVGA